MPLAQMTLAELNALPHPDAVAAFLTICASPRWAMAMAASRPFLSIDALRAHALDQWATAEEGDWLAAFAGHPKIGDARALTETSGHTTREQGQVASASGEVLQRLREGNAAYELKFGFIFIVCAKGKSAEQMLHLLETRLGNSRMEELAIAATEQAAITDLRLADWHP